MLQKFSAFPSPIVKRNLLFSFLAWAGGILFVLQRGLETKIPASLCFLLLGLMNARILVDRSPGRRSFALTLLAGLFFGFLADIVLELHFLGGAGLFALGHLCYALSYSRILPLKAPDIRCCLWIILPSLALILLLPVLDFGSRFMQGIVMVYAAVIGLMTGKAWSNFRRCPSPLTKGLMIGSLLFFFSDFMLLFAFFTDVGRIANILCLLTYYPGQAILAASLLLAADTL